MQDLRFVFEYLDAGTQQSTVECPRSTLRQRHIRTPSKQQTNRASATHNHAQRPAQPIAGDEIRGNDLNVIRPPEIMKQSAMENVAAQTGTSGKHELPSVRSQRASNWRTTPASEPWMPEVVMCEQNIERLAQRHRGPPVQLQPQIEPAAHHSVPIILRSDVETTDECHLVVDQQQFAVIADREAVERKRIEDANIAACSAEFVPIVRGQRACAKSVDQHLY